MVRPESIADLIELVRSTPKVIPVGRDTKPVLAESAPSEFEKISMLGLSGIVEYDPSEYTITSLAGTPFSILNEALAEHGQYLPFDPPLASEGATIGGTVAAGLSGPGSFRFGPVRDFLIGVKFVSGDGKLIVGGGKVVKNAAGFDIPKFLIGSCGRLGIISEVTFKVFPKPEASLTFGLSVEANCRDTISRLSREAFDLDSLEYDPAGKMILIGISGNSEALSRRAEKIEEKIGIKLVERESDAALNFEWASPGMSLAKFPIVPRQIDDLESLFTNRSSLRRYSMGANVLYLNASIDQIEETASKIGQGLAFRSPDRHSSPWVRGKTSQAEVENAIKLALDPNGKFPCITN